MIKEFIAEIPPRFPWGQTYSTGRGRFSAGSPALSITHQLKQSLLSLKRKVRPVKAQ
jgi:hypothetical protein